MLGNEGLHHLNAPRIVHYRELHVVLGEKIFRAHKGFVLPDDNASNAIKQRRTGTHDTGAKGAGEGKLRPIAAATGIADADCFGVGGGVAGLHAQVVAARYDCARGHVRQRRADRQTAFGQTLLGLFNRDLQQVLIGHAKLRRMGILILLAVALACIIAAGTAGIIQSMRVPPRKTYGAALAHGLPTTPQEIDFPFEEHTVTYRDGSATTVWEIDAGGPDDLAVIMTHGFGDSRYGALTWAPLFSGLCGKLFVYDLRAHGDSTAKHGCYSAKERDDLVELMDMLILPPRVVLFGYSMGAVISISAAGQLKDRIAGVIADGPYRKPMEPIIGHMLLNRWPPYPFAWLVDWHLLFWWRSYMPFDRVEQVKQTTCPLLVLHGTADPICKFQSAKQLVDAAPASSTLIAFEGGGHLDLAQRDQQRYIGALRNFLEKIGGKNPEVRSQETE